ncbi:MAG: alanine racemase, partial [Sutterellaceae bacterium]|nr:alanine racemase [Sutterellaceae bacterium]
MDALRHNTEVMRRAAGDRFLWVVAKANAYGHGLENAAKAFSEADGIVILDISDAPRLRAAGWKKPILMIEGFFDPEDIPVLEKA